jgi:sulfur carrier protein ThiS adenylyltransferase
VNTLNGFEQGLRRYLDPDSITKLQKVKVGIAGAGGLGSNCAQMLVRSGFKRFKIVDFDVIEHSNLNRQFYFQHQVGRPKVVVLRENLAMISDEVGVEALQVKIGPHNVVGLFADCDVVVEAFDRPEYKKIIVEAFMNSAKLLVAASGLAGWGDSDNIITRKIKENFYLVGDSVSAVGPDCPPMAPRVHIAAAKQADVILSYFLNRSCYRGQINEM